MWRRWVEEFRRTVFYQLIELDVINPIREKYPQEYQASMEVVAKVADTLRKDLRMAKEKVWASPTLRNAILKIIDFSKVSRHPVLACN